MPFQKGQVGGPGRPKKADNNAGAVAAAEKQIRDRLPSLIENMFKLAEGVWYEDTGPTGVKVVYKERPNYKANEYLINRIAGKPTERQEVSGPEGSPIPLAINNVIDRVYSDSTDTPTE